jgi:hypothetical protein
MGQRRGTGRPGTALRGAGFVLALGAVSWAWSEPGFWAGFRAGDGPGPWLLTWLAYSVVTGLSLRLARAHPAPGVASLVVVGAAYGWLVEGGIAGTTFEQLPFSLVWTGVAWHALLTVVVGWWAYPALLRRGGRRAWLASAGLGAAWGIWAAGWWTTPPDDGQVQAVPEPLAFLLFATVVSAAAALGYWLMHVWAPGPDQLRGRAGLIGLVVVLLAWFAVVVVPAIPWAPVVLAALLALAWATLRRLVARGGSGAVPDAAGWPVGVPARALPPVLLVPGVALATYLALAPLAPDAGGESPIGIIAPAVIVATSLAGTVALVWALWRAWGPVRPRERVSATG